MNDWLTTGAGTCPSGLWNDSDNQRENNQAENKASKTAQQEATRARKARLMSQAPKISYGCHDTSHQGDQPKASHEHKENKLVVGLTRVCVGIMLWGWKIGSTN